MKQVVHGMFLGVIFIFCILCVIMIESRTNRESNVQQSLKKATKTAVEKVLEDQSYTIDSNEQFVAALAQVLCDNLISNAEIETTGNGTWVGTSNNDNTVPDKNLKLTLEIVKADFAKGLLCLNVVEEYTNPIGSIGTCEYATTVIFDEAQNYEQYTIQYYNANNVLISSYIVKEGDAWPFPSDRLMNFYHVDQSHWGSEIGGDQVPHSVDFDTILAKLPHHDDGTKYVPFGHMNNNMNTFSPFYDPDTKIMKIYGNYNGS